MRKRCRLAAAGDEEGMSRLGFHDRHGRRMLVGVSGRKVDKEKVVE